MIFNVFLLKKQMSLEQQRVNPKIIVANTSFFSLERIEEYFNILLKNLRENDEINAKLGPNISFIINVLPITLADITITNNRNEPEKLPYLTNYVNKIADIFENSLPEESKNNFKTRQRSYFFNRLYQKLEKVKLKRTVGRPYIYCDNEVIFNILLGKNLDGEDNFVRSFNIKDGNSLYTQEELDDFKIEKEASISKLTKIDLKYKQYNIDDIPEFFNYYSKDSYNGDRILFCKMINELIKLASNISTDWDSTFTVDETIIDENLKNFYLEKGELQSLLEIYIQKFIMRQYRFLFRENGLIYNFLVDKFKFKIDKKKTHLPFKLNLSEKLIKEEEGVFYIERTIFSNDDSINLFMKNLLYSINTSFKNNNYPSFFDNVIFDLIDLKNLVSKISLIGRVILETKFFSEYNSYINGLVKKYDIEMQKIEEEIDIIFGPLKKQPLIEIPGFYLNDEEKEWITKTRENIIKKIEIAAINGDNEEINQFNLMLNNMNPNEKYYFSYEEYHVDSKSKVDGDLQYPITGIKIPVDNNLIPCNDLFLAGKKDIIINFFKPFFSPFAPIDRQPTLTVNYKMNKFEKEVLYLFVSYNSSDDCYDASKFRTIFTTIPVNKIKSNPEFFTVRWEKTSAQKATLSGIDGERTLKLYKTPQGMMSMKLEYPFVDDSDKNIIESFLSEEKEKNDSRMAIRNVRTIGEIQIQNKYIPTDFSRNFPRTIINESSRRSADFYASMNRNNIITSTDNFQSRDNFPSRRTDNFPSRRTDNFPSRRTDNFPSRRTDNFPSRRTDNQEKEITQNVKSKFLNNRYNYLVDDITDNIDNTTKKLSSFPILQKIYNKNIKEEEGYTRVSYKTKIRSTTPGRENYPGSTTQRSTTQRSTTPGRENYQRSTTPGRENYPVSTTQRSTTQRSTTPGRENYQSKRNIDNERKNIGPIYARSISRGILPKGNNNTLPKLNNILSNYPNIDSPYSSRPQTPKTESSKKSSSSNQKYILDEDEEDELKGPIIIFKNNDNPSTKKDEESESEEEFDFTPTTKKDDESDSEEEFDFIPTTKKDEESESEEEFDFTPTTKKDDESDSEEEFDFIPTTKNEESESEEEF